MKKARAVSLLLSLSLLVSMALPGTLAVPAYAAEEPNKGMELSKTAKDNGDGTYTITLEAYATGKKISTEVKKDVPTDIVLVLDQSGSMDEEMDTYGFRPYTDRSNSDFYALRHNGGRNPNLYYKLEDGSYATVSVERSQTESSDSYTVCLEDWTNRDYYANQNNLYVKNSVGGYDKVTMSAPEWNGSRLLYTYTFPDGIEVTSEGTFNSPGNFDDKGPLYVRSTTQEYTYTYSYTDTENVKRIIGTSEGNNTQPTDFTLYERYSAGSVTRLSALKTAVTSFSNAVARKAAGTDATLNTEDDVNHRIAVVGFATGNRSSDGYPSYENTEVFIGSDQYNYDSDASSHYKDALQDMDTLAGYNNVIASKNALDARGATYPNYGLEMAKGILDANPVPEGEKRNRVVILFTDGTPGWSDFEQDVADDAVSQAAALKNAGVTVYSVGIFEGADATQEGIDTRNPNRLVNLFMQEVSSNNGTPQDPSYYLSASDADTLNNIFQQISDNIESGGAATTLGAQTVIQDLVSDYFSLPAGTDEQDITVQTAPCTGITGGLPSWGEPQTFTGAQVSVDAATGAVEVSGFDFAGNYVGMDKLNGTETLHEPANKLLISFCVEPKDGFLGGNGVPTNAGAYIYENKDATVPVFEFDKPTVDVPIGAVSVTAEDKNVYLLGSLTADGMQAGATIKIGDVELKPDEPNYGLQSWQNEFVDITVSAQDADGNPLTDQSSLKEDTSYTISLEAAPKSAGTVSGSSDDATAAVRLFRPELTYRDSRVYYGESLPDDWTANKVSEVWKHGDTTSTDAGVVMVGEAPVLQVTCTPDSAGVLSGKVNSKQDISVRAQVKIGAEDVQLYTTFVHQACEPACSWNETAPDGDPAFLLHVDTCQLTISKQGGAADEPYVFDVYKDGSRYTEVTITGNGSQTIYELPVGSYTISEDSGWSWRYKANNGGSAELSRSTPSGSLTCTNSRSEPYWLNGFSQVVQNIFGAKN